VVDQVDVQSYAQVWRDDRLEGVVSRLAAGIIDETQPAHDPAHMRVDREARVPERVRHHAARGLWANAWKTFQEALGIRRRPVTQKVESQVPSVGTVRPDVELLVHLVYFAQETVKVIGALLAETGRAHDPLYGRESSASEAHPRGELLSEIGEHPLVHHFSRLLTEQDIDRLAEHILQVAQVGAAVTCLE